MNSAKPRSERKRLHVPAGRRQQEMQPNKERDIRTDGTEERDIRTDGTEEPTYEWLEQKNATYDRDVSMGVMKREVPEKHLPFSVNGIPVQCLAVSVFSSRATLLALTYHECY